MVLELVDDLGLRDEAIAPAKGSGRRFLYLDGRIQEVAPSLRTPLGRTLLRGALRQAPRVGGARASRGVDGGAGQGVGTLVLRERSDG